MQCIFGMYFVIQKKKKKKKKKKNKNNKNIEKKKKKKKKKREKKIKIYTAHIWDYLIFIHFCNCVVH